MKIVTLCDSDGVIKSVATVQSGGPSVSFPNPHPSEQQIVVEAPDIAEDMPSTEILDRLLEIRDRHRVDLTERKFVPK